MDTSVTCPICSMDDILTTATGDHESATCGHEWEADPGGADGLGTIVDANGTELHDGDSVVLVKGLPLKGTDPLKIGTKVNNIRLIAGDHEIDCKINGRGILLKAKFVKKA